MKIDKETQWYSLHVELYSLNNVRIIQNVLGAESRAAALSVAMH